MSVEENRTSVQLTETAFNYTAASSNVFDKSCGAVSSFIGLTREDSSKLDGVSYTSFLVYSAYKPMANLEMTKICDEIRSTFPSVKLVIGFCG